MLALDYFYPCMQNRHIYKTNNNTSYILFFENVLGN